MGPREAVDGLCGHRMGDPCAWTLYTLTIDAFVWTLAYVLTIASCRRSSVTSTTDDWDSSLRRMAIAIGSKVCISACAARWPLFASERSRNRPVPCTLALNCRELAGIYCVGRGSLSRARGKV
jgi:hypothetical protein